MAVWQAVKTIQKTICYRQLAVKEIHTSRKWNYLSRLGKIWGSKKPMTKHITGCQVQLSVHFVTSSLHRRCSGANFSPTMLYRSMWITYMHRELHQIEVHTWGLSCGRSSLLLRLRWHSFLAREQKLPETTREESMWTSAWQITTWVWEYNFPGLPEV